MPAHTIVDDIVRESRDPELDRKFAEACVRLDRFLDALNDLNLHNPAMGQDMGAIMQTTDAAVTQLRVLRKAWHACGCEA